MPLIFCTLTELKSPSNPVLLDWIMAWEEVTRRLEEGGEEEIDEGEATTAKVSSMKRMRRR